MPDLILDVVPVKLESTQNEEEPDRSGYLFIYIYIQQIHSKLILKSGVHWVVEFLLSHFTFGSRRISVNNILIMDKAIVMSRVMFKERNLCQEDLDTLV